MDLARDHRRTYQLWMLEREATMPSEADKSSNGLTLFTKLFIVGAIGWALLMIADVFYRPWYYANWKRGLEGILFSTAIALPILFVVSVVLAVTFRLLRRL